MQDRRLTMAAELLGPCERLVDVGSNHGLLGAYMLARGLCREALLTDISPLALKRAERTLRDEKLEGRARLLVTDGLEGISLREDDGVAICGMGARTILHILQKPLPCRAVLQPNVELAHLRQSLGGLHLSICGERIACSAGRFYVLLAVEPGEDVPYSDREAVLGRFLHGDPLLEPYLAWRRDVARAALRGALAGRDDAKLQKARMEVEALEEA